jgi:hypothetical protein
MTTQQRSRRPGVGPRVRDSGPALGAPRSLPGAPRRYGQWAGTVLFIVVMGLGAGYLYMAKGSTTEILVLDREVAAGQAIGEDDLGSAQIAGVADAVAIEDLGDVVGLRALTGLVPGQVLTHGALTDEPVPGRGERVVALRLEVGRVPGTLTAGSRVNVLAVPPAGDAWDLEALDTPLSLTAGARVHDVREAVDGSVVVSLLVAESEADQVAAYSSAGRVTVVQASVAGE